MSLKQFKTIKIIVAFILESCQNCDAGIQLDSSSNHVCFVLDERLESCL
jgi:hypothetical protein